MGKIPLNIKVVGYDIENEKDFLESYLYRLLNIKFDVKWLSDNPDVLFYSWYNNDFLNYNCPKVFLASERYLPSAFFADVVIGNGYYTKEKVNSNIVLFYIVFGDYIFTPQYREGVGVEKTEFCNFIYSNKNCKVRNNMIDKMLCKFGDRVHSWGRVRRNIERLEKKNIFLENMSNNIDIMSHYKFSICFENSSHPASFSEKVYYALAAGSVPIYWGGSDIYKYIKKEAFIDANDFSNLDDLISFLDKVDGDEALYAKYKVDDPILKSSYAMAQLPENVIEDLCPRIISILGVKMPFYRRGLVQKILFYILNIFYKKHWRLKTLKRRFFGGR